MTVVDLMIAVIVAAIVGSIWFVYHLLKGEDDVEM